MTPIIAAWPIFSIVQKGNIPAEFVLINWSLKRAVTWSSTIIIIPPPSPVSSVVRIVSRHWYKSGSRRKQGVTINLDSTDVASYLQLNIPMDLTWMPIDSSTDLARSGVKEPSVSSQWHILSGFLMSILRAACNANNYSQPHLKDGTYRFPNSPRSW